MFLRCLLLLTVVPLACQAAVSDQCASSFALAGDVQHAAALSCTLKGATAVVSIGDADWKLKMLAAIGAQANECTHGMMTRSKKRRQLSCIATLVSSVKKFDSAPKKEQPLRKRVPRLAQRGRRQRKIVYQKIPLDYKPVLKVDYNRHLIKGHLGWCVCSHCNKLLRSMTAMNRHLNGHVKYPNRPYPCKYCDASFMQSSHRSVHEKKFHRGFD